MKKTSILRAIALAAVAALAFAGCQRGGGDWPSRAINVTVPFGAGGTTDLTARALGNAMGQHLNQTVNVTNTPGASGATGTLQVERATLDGYSLLTHGMLSFTTMPVKGDSQTTFRDWDIWIATLAPNCVVVREDSPYMTIEDLVEAIRANPGQISAGTAGIASGGHFGAEVVRAAAGGAEYRHVPYAGGAPALTALLAGEVDFLPQLLAEYVDLVIAGQLRPLAVLTTEAVQLTPQIRIPSIMSAFPETSRLLPMGEVTAVLVPRGLPENVLEKIDGAFDFASRDPQFLRLVEERRFQVIPMGRAESQAFLESFAARASFILFDAGVVTIDPAQFGFRRS
jgi:tripartite-type tricarboxylate transporter receptor subunit TctC